MTRWIVLLLVTALSSGCGLFRHKDAPKKDDEPVLSGEQPDSPVIDPEIERRKVVVPHIEAQNYEAGLFLGVISVEDLQSHAIYGVRGAYHLTEDFFVEGEFARSEVSDEVRRTIGQPFFPHETVSMTTYGLGLGYNLFPGELFVGTKHAMNSTVYVFGGVGDTFFDHEHYLTYTPGIGIKVLPNDWLCLRLDVRDRVWKSDLLGDSKWTNNFEATLGVSYFFSLF